MTPIQPATSSAAVVSGPQDGPERLALDFFARVWAPPHDLAAIDELMTEDYTITSGGVTIRGRDAFKAWVREFQTRLLDATNETLECSPLPRATAWCRAGFAVDAASPSSVGRFAA